MKTQIEQIELELNFDKSRDDSSYTSRVGEPDELSAVIGRITMGFQYLENRLDEIISEKFLGLDKETGLIITAELSFRNKVNLFASLYYKLNNERNFNLRKGIENEHFTLFLKALTKCEELRNQILHSSITKDWKTNEIVRTKVSSKMKRGLTITNQTVDIPYLFDVADFMNQIEFYLGESFIV